MGSRYRIVLLLALLLPVQVRAFHNLGVAHCDACHSMHNSEDGLPQFPGQPLGQNYLLKFDTPSEACLSCHANEYGAVLGADPLNPPPEMGAGNFVFLREDNVNDGPNGGAIPIGGDAAGHNFDAPGWGIATDGTYNHSPGGHFPAQQLSCTSCHDPHGNTNYRMLHGIGPRPGAPITFFYAAPVATGIDLDSDGETIDNHNAYLSGMSNWCGNCHAEYLVDHNRSGGASLRHPVDESLSSGMVDRYNAYNGDADPEGGNAALAYLVDVPFEDMGNMINSTVGPSYGSRVFCLSCHRAHASSAPRATRWDHNILYLAHDGIMSGSYPIPIPYDDPEQMHLCHKCHAIGDDHEFSNAKN
jgi:predicted CXXCH cytochrome family protein